MDKFTTNRCMTYTRRRLITIALAHIDPLAKVSYNWASTSDYGTLYLSHMCTSLLSIYTLTDIPREIEVSHSLSCLTML